ncbi:DUF1092 domain containing protein [Nitzschia inconspicua]|uniref:DUF1092 domain containing protein n=1 Tax=Nitzschia inconspicua TaxID=303405 RepID=A0A9K3Q038_9STRA|nr:DUF1092 domain containing protein [Nitzschia inconspicua]
MFESPGAIRCLLLFVGVSTILVGCPVEGFNNKPTISIPSVRHSSPKISTITFLSSTAAGPSGSSPTSSSVELQIVEGKKPSVDWELDCYSRPVVAPGGKKLWEVLVTDSTGSFRFCKTLPSNQVNSKELRKTVEDLMDDASLPVKPTTIRFFRGAMFNMINIALSDLDVVGRPSRCTYAIAQWLEERHRDVYPQMEGYRANMATSAAGPSFLDVRTPVKMPDALRGEKYAFVSLPLAEFLPGGGVNDDNIGVGRLCPIDPLLPADSFVQGVVILTQRPEALAAWLAGTEVAALSCDLRKRNLIMETNIDTQYLMARLNDQQRIEGAAFEEGKDALNGLHFVCVQRDEDDDPAGFWLMRQLPSGI